MIEQAVDRGQKPGPVVLVERTQAVHFEIGQPFDGKPGQDGGVRIFSGLLHLSPLASYGFTDRFEQGRIFR